MKKFIVRLLFYLMAIPWLTLVLWFPTAIGIICEHYGTSHYAAPNDVMSNFSWAVTLAGIVSGVIELVTISATWDVLWLPVWKQMASRIVWAFTPDPPQEKEPKEYEEGRWK